jgi:hypothetical protein
MKTIPYFTSRFPGSHEVNYYRQQLLSEESQFINLCDDQNVKYAREEYVYKKMSKKLMSCYSSTYTIVGYTMNNKDKVIRVFFNKFLTPEGDMVSESVHYPITLGVYNSIFDHD